jgi:hypothetical protein
MIPKSMGAYAVAASFFLVACGQSSLESPVQPDSGADAPWHAEAATDGAGADDEVSGSLTLSLDPSLDQPDDEVKAQSITAAVMLDKMGASIQTATVSAGAAAFGLTSVPAGDYFLEINGDTNDLVPTRIDDAGKAITQRVGQKLRASYIGPPGSPKYRINTYSAGQNVAPVVRYSDDMPIAGRYAYVILAFDSSRLEINVLGSAQPLTALVLPRCAGHAYVPADGWLLNTPDEDHHGDVFKGDGGATECGSCHSNYSSKTPSFGDIAPSRGWCFRCHNGPDGAGAGFVDPTQ